MIVPPQRLPRRTRFLYSLGALALGVRDTGFNTFLLIFYNQALGLPAALAGLALALTLIADAVFDPMIGVVSDGWRSRLGRRHPFLYAAAVPAALAYFLLWHPPHGLGQVGLFAWLLAISVAARFLVSLFEVPFSALVAEFTPDYDERTSLLTWLFVVGWLGGLTLAVSAYAVFLRPTAGDPSGLMNRAGFATFGLVGSGVMLFGMLAAALGTQSRVRGLGQAAATRPGAAALAAALRNRSVVALIVSVILLSAVTGFSNSLYNYIQVFIWGLNAGQIGVLATAPFVAVFAALGATPWITRGRDKKQVAIAVALVAVVVQPLPVGLRLAGLFPANGSPPLMPILTLHSVFETGVWILFSIASSSMVADLVEAEQRRSGRQAAGAIFALRIFAQKTVSGLGVLLSGLALGAVGFSGRRRARAGVGGHHPRARDRVCSGLHRAGGRLRPGADRLPRHPRRPRREPGGDRGAGAGGRAFIADPRPSRATLPPHRRRSHCASYPPSPPRSPFPPCRRRRWTSPAPT
jgi:GPH family glycoside/pentoside/hexuronide:cation symporter